MYGHALGPGYAVHALVEKSSLAREQEPLASFLPQNYAKELAAL